jgi:alkaline phosphatase D
MAFRPGASVAVDLFHGMARLGCWLGFAQVSGYNASSGSQTMNRLRIASVSVVASCLLVAAMRASEPDASAARQASGVKVGEVTDTTAIVWTRLTADAERKNHGLAITGRVGKGGPRPVTVPVDELEGACPGAEGRIRVRYSTSEDLKDAAETKWADVNAKTDFSHQFHLKDLRPATTYQYAVETTGKSGQPRHGALRGKFTTAPTPAAEASVRFCVMTCQAYFDRDHPDGHNIYVSMLRLDPKFVAFTGDNVYYDSEEPRALTPRLARYHWERMFSLPRQRELLRNVGSYFEKDDHDTVNDDSWPGRKQGELTFAEGQKIFRQQVPLGESIYRTFRWGRHLQIWLTDGRDFRSPNNTPDGPDKTIWGREQKEWLKQTLAESDATWKVLISPTPIVGPDRTNKADNHANRTFQHEGDEIRAWFAEHVPDNFFVLCGDRHWQYHSVHPRTGLNEFAVGAASDAHAGGSPGLDEEYHRFHRVKGGFVSVEAAGQEIVIRHHDVDGNAVNEYRKSAQGK